MPSKDSKNVFKFSTKMVPSQRINSPATDQIRNHKRSRGGPAGDHCCRETLGECPAGERISSIMLSLELPEWVGFLPPELVALMVTTTTMDAGTKLAMCQEYVLNMF